ncbi:peptidoglycan-binding protein [Hyphomonas sp.]|uniref:peptidoglycan-binding protein n=1 Tax=Hyphomonas sp. TaxID=87 RepID=UPI00391A961F
MSQTGPWSVKGIDQRAREAAREAALAEGLTLGEYLNRLLMASEDAEHYEVRDPYYEAPSYSGAGYRTPPRAPRSDPRQPHRSEPRHDAADVLERLSRRIEATEARSTLAITGIDHTVVGLVARLETTEQTTAAIAGHVEGVIEELRATHEALQAKVRRLEQDDTAQENLAALKALEEALGRLAAHVYEEAELAQTETTAIKGRVEAGFADLTDRYEGLETRFEKKLSEATARASTAIELAAARAESLVQPLSERLAAVETGVSGQAEADAAAAARLAALEAALAEKQDADLAATARLSEIEASLAERREEDAETASRLAVLEGDVTGTITSMEETLLRVQDRLNRAETATDAALRGLESTFAHLDERIGAVASSIEPDLAERLRSEFEARLEDMTQLIRSAVDNTRREIAGEIARAATRDSEAVRELKEELGTVSARLTEVEARDPEEFIAGVRTELSQLNETVSQQIGALAEQVETRFEENELRTADAIEQVGEQVTVAAVRLQKRQDESLAALAEEISASRKDIDARLSDALATVSERLDEIHEDSNRSISPVQRAIAALAARLEGLEAFAAPPGQPLPPPIDLTPEPSEPPAAPEPAALLPHTEEEDDSFEAFESFAAGEDAEAGTGMDLPDWDEPEMAPEAAADEEAEAAESSPYEDDFAAIRAAAARLAGADAPSPAPEEDEDDAMFGGSADASAEDEDDPFVDLDALDEFDDLAALDGIDDLDDGHSEARESDIFDQDDDLVSDDPFLEAADETSSEDGLISTMESIGGDDAPPKLDETTSDYLARARRAALAASEGNGKARAGNQKRGPGKAPLYLAASAMVLTGAGAGAYLYLRGKQAPEPALSAPVDTYVDPQLAAAPPAPVEAFEAPAAIIDLAAAPEGVDAAEEDLFDAAVAETAAPEAPAPATTAQEPPRLAVLTPARYPAIPPVVTVETEANAGNGIAQYQLAVTRRGEGRLNEAIPLLRRAALKGIAPAQYELGKHYERGDGVDLDFIQARHLIGQAAEAGHVGAMYDYALFLAEGEGGPKDEAAAVNWFTRAAGHGLLDAKYNLGVVHAEGMGTPRNPAEALFWFELARRAGDDAAGREVRSLSARLPEDTVIDMLERADGWRAAPSPGLANGRFGAQSWNTGNPLQVRGVQVALDALGYAPGTADGVLGGQTARAIREYQAAEGLPVTGTVTPDLIERLNTGASSRRG